MELHVHDFRLGHEAFRRRKRRQQALQRAHVFVVGGRGAQLGDQPRHQIDAALITRDSRHLFVNLDRLLGLADGGEGAGEQAQRLEIARVGLKTDLELRQREQAVVAAAATQVNLRRRTCDGGLGAKVQNAIEHLERIVTAAELE